MGSILFLLYSTMPGAGSGGVGGGGEEEWGVEGKCVLRAFLVPSIEDTLPWEYLKITKKKCIRPPNLALYCFSYPPTGEM